MPAPYIQVAVHFIWSTWDRLPLLPPAVLPRMHAAIAAKCRELGCAPIAIGGTVDHTHALIGMKAACSISDVAQAAKGYSSCLMTHEFAPGAFFKWQGSYGAIAVAHADIGAFSDTCATRRGTTENTRCCPSSRRPRAKPGNLLRVTSQTPHSTSPATTDHAARAPLLRRRRRPTSQR